jgi:hypothetical protein
VDDVAERALAAKPAVAPVATTRKIATRVHAQDAAHEQEADRAAEAVMSGPHGWAQRAALPRSRPRAQPVLALSGRGLDPATRSFMESRFGYGFAHVRIHDDERAARSADALDALAYTSGASIVFSRAAYAPRSPDGRRLLAHELAHVVQQERRPELAGTIQRKPKPKPAPPTPLWYQEAIDAVDLEKQRQAENLKTMGMAFESAFFPSMLALLRLCESVDRKQWDVVPTNIDKLLKAGLPLPLWPFRFSRELLTELSARIFEMGLEADAERLRKAYAAADKSGILNTDDYAARRKVDYLTRLVAGAKADAKGETPDALTTSVKRYTRVFILLRDEYSKIDFEALRWEQQSGMGRYTLRPWMSHEEFHDAIFKQIEEWLRGLSTLLQTAMDTARRDLELPAPTGSGAALLKAMRLALIGELRDVLDPKDRSKNLVGLSFPITTTKMGKGKGTVSDQFSEGKEAKAREVPVFTYNPEQEYAAELRTTLGHFWRTRIEQLDVLGRIYGVLDLLEPEKTPAETKAKEEKARDTAETIRRMSGGRLRLDNDDDWRVFLLQRFQDLTNPPTPAPATTTTTATTAPAPVAKKALTDAEALHEIVDLLFKYLQAFTVHARFTNLYDFGEPSYINRPFPRALTGQLVHDCGVYALRVAYILSLVRKELGLRFRFVVLPVHVSLVITGEKLPTFIVENDHFTEISPAELEQRRKAWEAFKDPTTKAPLPGPADEEQFIGELASSEFISHVDMPFKVSDVPRPVSKAKDEQKQLWAYYQKINKEDIFGPSSQKKNDPNYLFELHYLELTEKQREAYNETLIPFWNVKAPDAWEEFEKKIKGPAPKPGETARTEIKVGDLLTALSEYKVAFGKAQQIVKARYDSLQDEKLRLSKRLRDDPKLRKAGVRLSYGLRALEIDWMFYWDRHTANILKYEADLLKRSGLAKEPLANVPANLKPPFVPREEKRREPLD